MLWTRAGPPGRLSPQPLPSLALEAIGAPDTCCGLKAPVPLPLGRSFKPDFGAKGSNSVLLEESPRRPNRFWISWNKGESNLGHLRLTHRPDNRALAGPGPSGSA